MHSLSKIGGTRHVKTMMRCAIQQLLRFAHTRASAAGLPWERPQRRALGAGKYHLARDPSRRGTTETGE